MLKVYSRKRGGIAQGMVRDISTFRNNWISCTTPTTAEKKAIAKKLKIPSSRLRKFLRMDTRPQIYSNKNVSAVVLAAPHIHEKSKIVGKTPVTIFFKGPNNMLVLSNRKVDALDRMIKEAKDQPEQFRKSATFLREFISEINSDYFKCLDNIEDQIDKIEKSVFKRQQKKQMVEIFRLKKSLLYLHKALIANREILTMIEKGNIKQLPKKELPSFRYAYNDIIHLIDLQDTYQFIISGVMEMYLSQVSNNLNVIMKKLTSWAALVLIPTLIASIYGMNFKDGGLNMPELYWEYGYIFSLGLMIVSVAVMWIYFKKKDWL